MAEEIKVPAGVYDMVTRCMEQEFPDNVAIRYVAADGKTVVEKKYREYAQDIRRMTAYLKAEVPGIKGQRVVLLSRNSYEYCVASFGIILAGGVLVTLNQKKTWEELEYELGLVEPALILNDGIDYGCRAELEAAYGPKLRPMDCYRNTAPGELTNCIGHDDLMMLMFTSGTTGRSKGVMLSERNMCTSLCTYGARAENWITSRLPEGQKLPLSHMTLLPLFHMACFVCVMSYPPAGWALNLCSDIRDFYRDLGLMHSDIMASAPMLVETIYNDFKRGRVSRLNGLWDLCCSSAALDPKTASKVLNLTEEIVDENHLTTLMVTHNMNDAIRLGNRLIMMHEGHVIYDVAGDEKKSLTVADLLQKFEEVSGGELANDRMLLS